MTARHSTARRRALPLLLLLVLGALFTVTGPAGARGLDACDGGGRIVVPAGTFRTLSDCTISGNTSAGDGGGVLNHGTLQLINVTVSNNTASRDGGAIWSDGILSMTGGEVSDNAAARDGGALWNTGGHLFLTDVRITGNTAGRSGGGLYNGADGFDVARSVVFADNEATTGDGGAVWSTSFLALESFAVTGNSAGGQGGGVFARHDAPTVLQKGTIARNDATDGGGVFIADGGPQNYPEAVIQLAQLTIGGNHASARGGGVGFAFEGDPPFLSLELNGDTLVHNVAPVGGNLYFSPESLVNPHAFVINTIVADGGSNGSCNADHPAWLGALYDIDDGSSCGFTGAGSVSHVDPRLGPLRYNPPGPAFIETLMPNLGSPAIGAGYSGLCDTDARSVPFATCDIGAAAFTPPTVTVASTATGGGAFSVTATVTNTGTEPLTSTLVTISFPSSSAVTLVAGSNPAVVGSVPGEGSAQRTWQVLGVGPGFCTASAAFDVTLRYDGDGGTGRVVHAVLAGDCAKASGFVTYDHEAHRLPDAEIDLCPLPSGPCVTTTTDQNGSYLATIDPGSYQVRVLPGAVAPVTTLVPQSVAVMSFGPGEQRSDSFDLAALRPLSDQVSIGGAGFRFLNDDDVPVISLLSSWTVSATTTTGCVHGIATVVIEDQNAYPVFTQQMVEGPDGTYSLTIPAGTLTVTGFYTVKITIQCGTDDAELVPPWDVYGYIDPSGVVSNSLGDPVDGATVRLLRSPNATGTPTQVDDGSTIMSLANRRNPDTTGPTGEFKWDVLAGFYRVRAEKAGCISAETVTLAIPPPVTGLALTLVCASDLETLVRRLALSNVGLATDLANRAHSAATRLLASKPQGCDTLDAFVTQTVSEAGQDTPKLTIAQARMLATEAYELEAAYACPAPATTAPAAEAADLDLLGTVNSLTIDAGLASDLRTTIRQISTAITGGRNADAHAKVAAFLNRVTGQTNRKLTPLQAAALTRSANTLDNAIG